MQRFFRKLNSLGRNKESSARQNSDTRVSPSSYFNYGDGNDLLLTEAELEKDKKTISLALGEEIEVEKLLRWEVSSKTKANQKFIFASFFIIGLAYIDFTWGAGRSLYGLQISAATWPKLQVFLSFILFGSILMFLASRFLDEWTKSVVVNLVERKIASVVKVNEKWGNDQVLRGVSVLIPTLFFINNASEARSREVLTLFNQASLYESNIKNASLFSKGLSVIDFALPIFLGVLSLSLLNSIEIIS